MKLIDIVAVIAVVLLPAFVARAEPSKVGEEHEIRKSYASSQQNSNGSSGSSNGRDAILERVIAVSDVGLELEYDLLKSVTAEDRARNWQFPVRIFKPSSGPMRLLNGHELEARVEIWLKAAGWPRDVCGRWIFTWNAFRIECDPHSVVRTIEAFDLRATRPRGGALHQEPQARDSGTLERKSSGPDGMTFVTVLQIDPDAVRRTRAESDVVVGEIMRKPVTLDAALWERAKESVSGTISVTFETDSLEDVWRRTRVIKLEIKKARWLDRKSDQHRDGRAADCFSTFFSLIKCGPPVSADRPSSDTGSGFRHVGFGGEHEAGSTAGTARSRLERDACRSSVPGA